MGLLQKGSFLGNGLGSFHGNLLGTATFPRKFHRKLPRKCTDFLSNFLGNFLGKLPFRAFVEYSQIRGKHWYVECATSHNVDRGIQVRQLYPPSVWVLHSGTECLLVSHLDCSLPFCRASGIIISAKTMYQFSLNMFSFECRSESILELCATFWVHPKL